ncbi:methyltransferase domain-containing protein [Aminobacter sp. HY435]|uniref:methyltransferase domain-containing protein n=1 Tax=Aminobacter sp. HY435 TaxID=2970917 RepID=UPI0022B964F5|nr:methyltransferase domain-containing protein [Aminobacter sp. HY435]
MIACNCAVCGKTEFRDQKVLWPELISEWELASHEVEYIDRQQGTCCIGCGAQLRANALAKAIGRVLQTNQTLREIVVDRRYQELRILDLNGCLAVSETLAALPGYVRADYPSVDMMAMHYPDSTFDLVVHSDTLEHIPDPVRALRECLRVVSEAGAVCYTIPIIVERLSRSRAGMPKSFHGKVGSDAEDFIVHTEFGSDFWTYPLKAGAHSVEICTAEFPAAQAITLRRSGAWNNPE